MTAVTKYIYFFFLSFMVAEIDSYELGVTFDAQPPKVFIYSISKISFRIRNIAMFSYNATPHDSKI